MYLLFIDESGTPPHQGKAAGKYLVIGGVVIPEGAWHGIAKDFNETKRKYGIRDEIKWKYFGHHNDDARNSLAHLTISQKDQLRDELFQILTSRKSVKIISCVTSVESAYQMPSVVNQDDIYHLTYKAVTERFQYYLQDASRLTGVQQNGIVISDHRMRDDDEKLRRRHHQLIDTNEQFSSNYRNFIETIFFSPSDISTGLVFADLVAGAINRAFQYNDARFIEKIKGSFRASPTGETQGYGLVKMPKGRFKEPSGGSYPPAR